MSNNDENDSVANGANKRRNQEVESESTQMKRGVGSCLIESINCLLTNFYVIVFQQNEDKSLGTTC
jgi:hypothetical protein